MKKLLIMCLFLFSSAACVEAENYDEGIDYLRVAEQQTDTGDKVEVLEFFWYGCPHCYTLDPYLDKWLKTKPDNVEFTRVPAVFRAQWKVHARTYYALQSMGVVEEIHPKLFVALHKERKKLYDLNSIADFVAEHGVDKKEFTEMYNSFAMDGKIRKANDIVTGYNIQGVPAVAVNGKYLVNGKTAGSYENLIKIVDYLIKKETK